MIHGKAQELARRVTQASSKEEAQIAQIETKIIQSNICERPLK
jgi:hypothetical protein